jgi:hypothetical protein
VGPELYERPLPQPVPGLVLLAGQQLVLTGQSGPSAPSNCPGFLSSTSLSPSLSPVGGFGPVRSYLGAP